MESELTHLDLFSGIGGFALAAEWAGFRTIGFVEIDGYCQRVLKKHWPNVPIVEDIRDVEKIKQIITNTTQQPKRESNYKGDTKPIKREAWPVLGNRSTKTGRDAIAKLPVTLVTGGFPCQPFSVAGKRRGKADNRYLWPEMLAVIKEVRPNWVLGENVAGIVRMELDNCLADLERIGYSTQAFVIPACAVNAPHRRDRVWIVANSIGREGWCERGRIAGRIENKGWQATKKGGTVVCPWPQVSFASQSRQASDIVAHSNSHRERERYRGDSVGEVSETLCNRQNSEDTQDESSHIDNGSQHVANTKAGKSRQQTKPEGREDSGRGSQEVATADTQREGLERADTERNSCTTGQPLQSDINSKGNGIQGRRPIIDSPISRDWWAAEPELGRVAHGIPNRVDRLKCLGNAIVPQVAYQILKRIAGIERGQA